MKLSNLNLNLEGLYASDSTLEEIEDNLGLDAYDLMRELEKAARAKLKEIKKEARKTKTPKQ